MFQTFQAPPTSWGLMHTSLTYLIISPIRNHKSPPCQSHQTQWKEFSKWTSNGNCVEDVTLPPGFGHGNRHKDYVTWCTLWYFNIIIENHLFTGESTISMAMFTSYVKLPEGNQMESMKFRKSLSACGAALLATSAVSLCRFFSDCRSAPTSSTWTRAETRDGPDRFSFGCEKLWIYEHDLIMTHLTSQWMAIEWVNEHVTRCKLFIGIVFCISEMRLFTARFLIFLVMQPGCKNHRVFGAKLLQALGSWKHIIQRNVPRMVNDFRLQPTMSAQQTLHLLLPFNPSFNQGCLVRNKFGCGCQCAKHLPNVRWNIWLSKIIQPNCRKFG